MAKTDVDEFADLLPETFLVPVQNKKALNNWVGPIPESARQWAELGIKAYVEQAQERRVSLPCRSPELAGRLHSAIKAAVIEQDPDLTIYTTHTQDDDGNVTHFSFVVGRPRGKNNSKES